MPTCNMVVPSTLYQCIKYCNEHGEVCILIADKQLFKVVDNYFIDTMLYEYVLEASNESTKESDDNSNEADSELEPL